MTRKELRKLHEASQARFALAMILADMDRRELARVLGWSLNKLVRTWKRMVPLKKGRKRRDKATGKTNEVKADPTKKNGKI